MTEDCKELEKLAKQQVKDNPREAVGLYLQLADCFDKEERPKDKKSSLDKAAIVQREYAKSIEDPAEAEIQFKEASAFYSLIEKDSDAEKVMLEAYQKYVISAKNLRSEAGKIQDLKKALDQLKLASDYATKGRDEQLSDKCWMDAGELLRESANEIDDPVEAEVEYIRAAAIYTNIKKQSDADRVMQEAYQKYIESARSFKAEAGKTSGRETALLKLWTASEYAIRGNDEQLNNDCWIDSGEILRKSAESIEDPREALEIYIRSANCYRKGKDEKKYISTFDEAADKFMKEAVRIHKSQKTLLLALDNYLQASTIYRFLDQEAKMIQNQEKIDEICDLFGLSLEILTEQLAGQGLTPISMEEREETEIEDVFPIAKPVQKLKHVEEIPLDVQVLLDTEIDLEPERDNDSIIQETKIITTEEITEQEVESEMSAEEIAASEARIEALLQKQDSFEEENLRPSMMMKPEAKTEPIKLMEEKLNLQDIKSSGTDSPKIIEDPEPVFTTKPPDEIPLASEKQPIVDPPVIKTPSTAVPETRNRTSETLDTSRLESESAATIRNRIKSELRGQEVNKATPEDDARKTSEIQELFENVLDESSEDFFSEYKDVIFVDRQGEKPVLTGPIIQLLRKQGYIGEDLTTEAQLVKVPEYQILLIIIKNHPISLEKIEELTTDLESVSLPISNLQADKLIEQTNDYRWTISKYIRENLRDMVSQNVEIASSIQEIAEETHEEVDIEPVLFGKQADPLIEVLHKYGIINETEVSPQQLRKIPEFAIIKTIRASSPINLSELKESITDFPSVQITRKVSRLETDGLIEQDSDGNYKLTAKLANELK